MVDQDIIELFIYAPVFGLFVFLLFSLFLSIFSSKNRK